MARVISKVVHTHASGLPLQANLDPVRFEMGRTVGVGRKCGSWLRREDACRSAVIGASVEAAVVCRGDD